MKVLKKLLFLACLASIWPMLGMNKKENRSVKKIENLSAEQIKYIPFINETIKPDPKSEEVQVQSLTLPQFMKTLNYGAKRETTLNVNYSKSITDPNYKDYLFGMKFVDFVTVHPKQKLKPKRHEETININDFHVFFNFDEVETPLLNQIGEFSEKLNTLTEENKHQKLEIEKLTKQNKETKDTLTDQIKAEFSEQLSFLTEKNKKQKLKIEKLTQQNKEWGKKINDFRIFFDCDKVEDAGQIETEFSEQLSILTEENKKQKLEIEELAKQNQKSIGLGLLLGTLYAAFTLQNQNLQIAELTKQNEKLNQTNKEQEEKLNKITASKVEKSLELGPKLEQKHSFWQPKNLLFGFGALVVGGILGAWAHASFK